MTAGDLAAAVGDFIDARLAALEERIRADLAATGPEPERDLDAVPDPAAPWSRITVEEVLLSERARLECLRDGLLR